MHAGTHTPRPSAELFYSTEPSRPSTIRCCFCGYEQALNAGSILWDLERFFHHEELTENGPERHRRYAAGNGNRQRKTAQRVMRLIESRRSA
jgi:hypothetical protein